VTKSFVSLLTPASRHTLHRFIMSSPRASLSRNTSAILSRSLYSSPPSVSRRYGFTISVPRSISPNPRGQRSSSPSLSSGSSSAWDTFQWESEYNCKGGSNLSPAFRTIGTVEGLLVLSEWPPRAMLLRDPVGTSGSVSSPPTACKLFDDLTWTLTGLVGSVKSTIVPNIRLYVLGKNWVSTITIPTTSLRDQVTRPGAA